MDINNYTRPAWAACKYWFWVCFAMHFQLHIIICKIYTFPYTYCKTQQNETNPGASESATHYNMPIQFPHNSNTIFGGNPGRTNLPVSITIESNTPGPYRFTRFDYDRIAINRIATGQTHMPYKFTNFDYDKTAITTVIIQYSEDTRVVQNSMIWSLSNRIKSLYNMMENRFLYTQIQILRQSGNYFIWLQLPGQLSFYLRNPNDIRLVVMNNVYTHWKPYELLYILIQ